MKTPHLDNLINDLKAYDRNDMLSDNGRNQLNEYEAIKRALSLADVVGRSEQFYCSSSDDGQYPRCETQCLGCAGLEEQAKQ